MLKRNIIAALALWGMFVFMPTPARSDEGCAMNSDCDSSCSSYCSDNSCGAVSKQCCCVGSPNYCQCVCTTCLTVDHCVTPFCAPVGM